jgi:hypothetical protein
LQLEYQEVNFKIDEIGRIETSWLYTIYSTLRNRENKCFLSRSNLQEACQSSMEEHLERIRKDIVGETIKEMNQKIILHFRELHTYMEKYKRYAKLCLSDKLLDKENKTVFKSQLQKLEKEWISIQQEIEELTVRIDWDQLSKHT